ncbi:MULTISPECIES: ABCB family ABC transporter ATP-binding protein/permease [Massilia]|uniref:ABCB family ABC transporter ATP-binding protein/permease n=1 Tax=Massilia orientalis TaxID=3050128 RepID=A0ACC7MKV5_9BURK|nr:MULTISPECIES: ABC transporter ATP-binding protein/permease [unclassified Massilia]KQY16891.1 metal ABC transporter permease [Massilia sp. Root133]KQZ46113.1 metal ABC transporter permease [Massilia sp. Root1485]MDN4045390.1 ABC transporter ATP-binding protein/permease [Massilia sp. YIM B02787]
MRRSSPNSLPPQPDPNAKRNDWATIGTLLPYLWVYKWRVLAALICLVGAKMANVGVPLVLKKLIDALTISPTDPHALLVLPLGALVAYGALRFSTTLFTELREFLFARVTQRAVRTIALKVFRHLHALSLRFHLNRQTGGMTRDIERGTRGVSSLVSYSLFSILPTLVEITLVLGYLGTHYDAWFAGITAIALVTYITFTVTVTEWRTHFRRTMNELDSKANTKAIDSLINYETVKYFGNEDYEAKRYDEGLQKYEQAAVRSQTSLSFLNTGQSLIIAAAVTAILWRATQGVIDKTMTLGDLVLVNSFMIQLYIPLNFLGVIYREIKQSLADMERLFGLLEQNREVADSPDAKPLVTHGAKVEFSHVEFSYDPKRQILFDVDFTIPPGTTTAVVGHSGSGKSTLSRLLFRFYDVQQGAIRIDGQDVKNVTQDSLRHAIGIVPQDTVLFNDTIEYNIAYGRPGASRADIVAAARAASIHDFIETLPDGYATMVGERGLKLSGGEKQRVAIARTLLKNPAILIFDEATSALDSKSEQAIQAQLKEIAKQRTTLVIAHRLSTIADAHQILVLDHGRIVERGTHAALIAADGLYRQMWDRQQARQDEDLASPPVEVVQD